MIAETDDDAIGAMSATGEIDAIVAIATTASARPSVAGIPELVVARFLALVAEPSRRPFSTYSCARLLKLSSRSTLRTLRILL